MAEQPIDEAPAAHFMLDSHHLALLDRFVARARRQAKQTGHQFTGVVLEIDVTRPVSVHAADLEPLVLGLEPCNHRLSAAWSSDQGLGIGRAGSRHHSACASVPR